MSIWFKPQVCRQAAPRGPIDTRTFTYDDTATPYVTDTIDYSLLAGGIDQLVIEGTIPAPNTVVYMPPHTALLDLFSRPRADDQFAIDVSNTGANSVDLTIYKANSAPTGSPEVEYTQPMRIATIPAASVVRLYLRVINATPVTGVADVKMLVTIEGGTGSIPTPVIQIDMAGLSGAAVLLTQQIIQSMQPGFQLMFVNGAAAGTVALPTVPSPSAGPAQLLYPYGNTAAPPLISPLTAGDVFSITLQSSNQSGFNLTWLTNGIAGVTLTGSTTQPSGSTYTVTFRFRIAGTAPAFLSTTLGVDLGNVYTSRVGQLVSGLTSPTPASDFLKCDGSAVLQSAYPSLYGKLGLLPSFTTSTITAPVMQFGPTQIAYSPTLGLYVGITTVASGTFFTSTDGSNWTGGNDTWINPATHIHWSPPFAAFVVCCSSTTLNLSYDGYRFVAIETNTGVLFSHAASSSTVLCAYGAQALVGTVNRIWTTIDSTLQSWSKVNLTGSSATGAASADLYYAPAPMDIFCLALTTPLIFQVANGLGGIVTPRTNLTDGGTVSQFASDAVNIYAASSASTVYFSNSTGGYMNTWTTCKQSATSSPCSGVAANRDATGTQARLVAASSTRGIFTSQTAVAASTMFCTFSITIGTITNNQNLISWNPNFPGPNKYVRVYNNIGGTFAVSADLINWFNPSVASLTGVTSIFQCTAADPRAGVGTAFTVVAGTDPTLTRYSADGITWTASTPLAAVSAILYMIWSPSIGGFLGATASRFITSIGPVGTAGVAWVVQSAGVGVPSLINGVADNGTGTLVAITSNVTTISNYMTCVDNTGTTWTARQLDSGDVLNGVAWNGAVFCIVTLQSSVYTWDGTGAPTWTPRQGLDRSTLLNNVIAVGSTLVLFSQNANTTLIAISVDNGVTFSTSAIPTGVRSMNYVNGLAVAMGQLGQTATSVDARTWLSKNQTWNGATFGRCYYLNGLYFIASSQGMMVSDDSGSTFTWPRVSNVSAAIGAFGKIIVAGMPFLYSTNLGGTWINPKSFSTGSTVNDTAYSPTLGLVVAVGGSTPNGVVFTTPDGVVWTTRFVANSLMGANARGMDYVSIVWAPATSGRAGMFVGCSRTNGRLIRSTDGVTWTESSLGSESAMTQICYNVALDLFCVVGELGYVATSRDLVSWPTTTCPNRATVAGVASLESRGFVAIIAPSGILYSPDGATWRSTLLPVSISTTNGANVPIYYSATLGGVFIPAATAATYMFTNDGQTVTLCQGAGSGALAYHFVRHDEAADVLIAGTSTGCIVMPRTYNPATNFALPVMPNTWIRAT